MTTRKTTLKKRIRKKAYFFLESPNDNLKALSVPMGSGKMAVWEAENKARTIALKKKLKLAGGYNATGEKPYGLKKSIFVPFSTKPTPAKRDIVDDIMDYEGGNFNDKQTKKLFKKLKKTGLGYKLQGHYGRRLASGWGD